MPRDIVLVHGAFHTGECWATFAPLLATRGFTVHTPTLRGHAGNPRHPLLVSMKTYADDVVACVEAIGRPAILLGHSLGGFPVSAAAERRPDLVSRLIYLAAAVPRPGTASLADTTPATGRDRRRPPLGASATIAPEVARASFYNRCTPDAQAHAIALLSPQPIRPLLGRIRTSAAGLGTVEKHAIVCIDDAMIPADFALAREAQPFASVRTLDADHSPFLSAPGALADAIAEIASG